MGVSQMCCGMLKDNACEVLILSVLKNLKLGQLNFEKLYELLTNQKFPDVHHSENIEETVSAENVKKIFDEHFVNEKSEFSEIQKLLAERMYKRIIRKSEESVSLQNVMLRLMSYLSDDNHDKVYYFFAISNRNFKFDENGLISVDSIRIILDKLMKYNLQHMTTDMVDIISNKEVYKNMAEDIKKVKDNYSESKINEFFDAKFTFEKKYEDLDKIVRTIKANYVIFDFIEIRPTYVFFFLKKEKDNVLAAIKK